MTPRKPPRGRPPRADKAATERLEIRLTKLERLEWQQAAAVEGITVSEWIRRLCAAECDRLDAGWRAAVETPIAAALAGVSVSEWVRRKMSAPEFTRSEVYRLLKEDGELRRGSSIEQQRVLHAKLCALHDISGD